MLRRVLRPRASGEAGSADAAPPDVVCGRDDVCGAVEAGSETDGATRVAGASDATTDMSDANASDADVSDTIAEAAAPGAEAPG